MLLEEWALISISFTGWTLDEIKNISPRERTNWLEMASFLGKVNRK